MYKVLYEKSKKLKQRAGLTLLCSGLFFSSLSAQVSSVQNSPSGFIENKGQLIDQNNVLNPKVKYLLSLPSLNVQLKQNSFSYDVYSTEVKHVDAPGEEIDEKNNQQILYHFHRIDIEFIGANANPEIVNEGRFDQSLNYYTTGTPESGIQGVSSYSKVTYKDLYPGIDLEFVARSSDSKPVEYNFIIHPGADPSRIQWRYKGVNSDLNQGKVVLTTRHGLVNEQIPHSYIKGNNQTVNVNYAKNQEGLFTFDIAGYDKNQTLIIDPLPSLQWATYYGDSGDDILFGICTDGSGNIYATGRSTSTSNIATSGSYQSTYGGGSGYGGGGDVILVKFNSSGTLQWATYYGNTAHEQGQSIGIDNSGNLYIQGTTSSPSGLGTTGCFQSNRGGTNYNDPFLAKFDNNGFRLWSTYYGAQGNDRGSTNALAVDANANVYFGGINNSANNTQVSSAGAYQLTNGSTAAYDEPFVAKFDSSGNRVWGTYYGGGGSAHRGLFGIAINSSSEVILVGRTPTASVSLSASPYQSSYGGGSYDAFWGILDVNGANLVYGTLVGGNGVDILRSCHVDQNGDIILSGYTESSSNIASSGAFQTSLSGSRDALLMKFSPSGSLIWSTYFGGTGTDDCLQISSNATGDLFFCGTSTSTSDVATTGAYQTSNGGGSDGFLTKFEGTGVQKWGTYIGGSGSDVLAQVVHTSAGPLTVGYTESSSGIATTGSHQDTYSGTRDGFIAYFQDLQGTNNAGINMVKSPSGYVCAGSQDIIIEVTNAGLNTIDSVVIQWEVNGVAQTDFKLTDSLAPGSNMDVTLGSVNFQSSALSKIKAWTTLPNNGADTSNGNDTVYVEFMPGLDGIYSIGGTSPDYATISDATADLNAFGVCGPVVFNLAATTFNERLELGDIQGISATNTISFIGAGIGSTIISSSSSSSADMATILLDGSDHITIRDMSIENGGSSFGAGIWISNEADSNSFVNLNITVDSTSSSTNVNGVILSGSLTGIADGITGNNNRFDSLDIRGGYYGVRLNGGGTSNNYMLGNTIKNSFLSAQYRYGVFLRSQLEPRVENTRINAPRFTTSTALTIEYSASIIVANNTLLSDDYGLYLNYVNKNVYASNFSSRVYNNMISSSADYALYVNQSSHLNIWHNSMTAVADIATARFAAFADVDLRNNHIENTNSSPGRYVLYADDVADFSNLDFNNYFTAGGFIYLNSSNYANLPVLQAALAQYNQGSFSRDPLFNSADDLHTSINLSGVYVGIDEDFDGDFRNTVAPVLGADEVNVPNNAGVAEILSPVPVFCAGTQDVRVRVGNYGLNPIDSVEVHWSIDGVSQGMMKIRTSIAIRGFKDTTIGTINFTAGDNKQIKVWTALPNGVQDSLRNNDTLSKQAKTGLSGEYSLGGTNADFGTFNEALGELSALGICSPVVINVAAGTYNERVSVREIEGASSVNTITFKGDGIANTTLSYSGSSNQDWGTLNFEGGDHFVFRDMTISAMGANYGIGIIISAQSDSNAFRNVAVQTNPSSTSLDLVGIAALPDPTDLYNGSGSTGYNNLFDSVNVNGGYYGIYLNGSDKYTRVSHSTFTDQYVAAIYANTQEYLEIDHNTMSPLRNTNFSYTVNVSMATNFKIHANTINASGDYGVYLAFGNMFGADPNYASSLYNNMISNTSGYAIYVDGSQEFTVYHNSFRSVGNSNAISAAVMFNGCNTIDLRNNHIRNDNPNSYALQAGATTFDSLDYNNYYSFGPFVRLGSPYSNLQDLKNAFPQYNQNSLSQDPQYIALTNLHTSGFIPGSYVGVNVDIDGEPRCPQTVSIGADDEDWGFAQPVISTNHMDFYTNYPVRFSHNIANLPQMNFEWYIDGTYINDSLSFGTSFPTAGTYTIKLKANRCIHNDSTELQLTIQSGDPSITIFGNSPDSFRVFTSYTDLGADAEDVFGTNINASIQSGNTIDSSILGTYYIWYTAEDAWGNKDSVVREVKVIDDLSPVLSLVGPDTLDMDVFSAINEPGSSAIDNYYSSVTITVDSSTVNTSVVGLYQMTYTAEDGSGNQSSIVRWVRVEDNERPVLTLYGLDTIIVKVNYPYVEPGAKVTDNYCKTGLTWEVDAYPNTSALGDYVLNYTATDCEGNVAISIQRVVRVIDNEAPVVFLNGLPVMKIQRWSAFNDPGVNITDNYYGQTVLNDSLKVVSDVNTNTVGTYSVCYQVTDPSNNRSNQVCRVVEVLENTTSVQSGIFSKTQVYPNPSKGNFTIDLGTVLRSKTQFEIYDMTGKKVHAGIIQSGIQTSEVFLSGTVKGVYIIRIQSENTLASFKVTIQ